MKHLNFALDTHPYASASHHGSRKVVGQAHRLYILLPTPEMDGHRQDNCSNSNVILSCWRRYREVGVMEFADTAVVQRRTWQHDMSVNSWILDLVTSHRYSTIHYR